jgi:NADH dehydrogenase FAD-containing subunit
VNSYIVRSTSFISYRKITLLLLSILSTVIDNLSLLRKQSIVYICVGISVEEKQRLLHCVVVGGGPTGVEFTGELSDFIMCDVREKYPHIKEHIKITLIEVHTFSHFS